MQIHELKILPEYFDAVISGAKNFELRKDDRNYKIGDLIILKEFDGTQFTGREIKNVPITYILKDCPEYGLHKGYCILGLQSIIHTER